jgi:uncharacterized protein YlxW (UPF0749 family)
MSLLVDLSAHSLDPGYAAAARRRAEAGHPPPSRRGGAALATGVLLATLLVVIAAVQAHVRAPAAARTRADLAAGVERQSRAVADLGRQVDALRADVARLRDASLAGSAAGAALTRRIQAEELASGAVAVTGPGVRVTLDDAADAGGSDRNRVLDRDLQGVVNALWAAGAEAIAIDGQRLTAQSAIRQAGDAILVDFQPLTPPYLIEAVGGPVTIETGFATSPIADRLRSYTQLYGLRFGYSRADGLQLPAAADDTLHYARPVPTPTHAGGTS